MARKTNKYEWGVCTNRDKDGEGKPCPKCNPKLPDYKQRIRIGRPFVCSECGEDLTRTKPPKGPWWVRLLAGLAVAAVATGCIFGLYKLLDHGRTDEGGGVTDTDTVVVPPVETIDTVVIHKTDTTVLVSADTTFAGTRDTSVVGKNEKLLIKLTEQLVVTQTDSIFVTQTDSLIITAGDSLHITGIDTLMVQLVDSVIIVKRDTTATPIKGPTTINPSWGRYEGPRNSAGKPHGNGILRITRQTTINGQTAYPGERIEGVFRDGYVNLGTWFQRDGGTVVIKSLKVI